MKTLYEAIFGTIVVRLLSSRTFSATQFLSTMKPFWQHVFIKNTSREQSLRHKLQNTCYKLQLVSQDCVVFIFSHHVVFSATCLARLRYRQLFSERRDVCNLSRNVTFSTSSLATLAVLSNSSRKVALSAAELATLRCLQVLLQRFQSLELALQSCTVCN